MLSDDSRLALLAAGRVNALQRERDERACEGAVLADLSRSLAGGKQLADPPFALLLVRTLPPDDRAAVALHAASTAAAAAPAAALASAQPAGALGSGGAGPGEASEVAGEALGAAAAGAEVEEEEEEDEEMDEEERAALAQREEQRRQEAKERGAAAEQANVVVDFF